MNLLDCAPSDAPAEQEPVRFYEIVANCHIAGRSFTRGDRTDSRELADFRRVLLAAGLIREIQVAARARRL